jgi:hypothetical protein
MWTAARLADRLAEETGLRLSVPSLHRLLRAAGLGFGPPARLAARIQTTRSKKAIETARDRLNPVDVFYYADEFDISWHPTLRAMWGPKGSKS